MRRQLSAWRRGRAGGQAGRQGPAGDARQTKVSEGSERINEYNGHRSLPAGRLPAHIGTVYPESINVKPREWIEVNIYRGVNS